MITIRHATELDYTSIVKISIDAWRQAYKGIFPDELLSSLSVEKRLEDRYLFFKEKDRYSLVAILNRDITDNENQIDGEDLIVGGDLIVGFCDFGISRRPQFGKGEIYSIYVKPSKKNLGIGKQLLYKAMEILEEKSFTPYIVSTLQANIAARRFYKKLGFDAIGEIMTDVGGRKYKEIVFFMEA